MSKADLIGGLHSVRTALNVQGRVIELWVDARRNDRRLAEIRQLAKKAGVAIHESYRDELEQVIGSEVNHQGVVARVKASASKDESALWPLLDGLDEPPFLLILDGVQDPHNLGACLRSANGAGVHAVIAPKDRSVGLTEVAVKVSSGASESTPFYQVTNLSRVMERLQQDYRVWMVGTAGEAESGLYQADLTGPLGLVMGGEGKGLRRLTREHCDLLVNLPMTGEVDSLNVSVATGVCLYEALRQRTGR